MEEEKRGLKEYITEGKKLNPKPTYCSRLAHIDMLAPAPFLLAHRRLCPSSVRPHSMCVHAKAKTRKPTDKQWKE